MCVGDCIDSDSDPFTAKYCSPCTDTSSYGTNTISYGSSGRKGVPALCSVLPPASNVGVLCCNATRTVLSVLSRTLHNHKNPTQWTTVGTLLICHCIQWNQSCHQFVAKHTLMSFITGLGFFCFLGQLQWPNLLPLLDAVIGELLTTAPQVDKHIWPERKVIVYATFVVCVRSIESVDIDLCLSLLCSSGRKPYITVKNILWVAVWHRIKWQEMGFFTP